VSFTAPAQNSGPKFATRLLKTETRKCLENRKGRVCDGEYLGVFWE